MTPTFPGCVAGRSHLSCLVMLTSLTTDRQTDTHPSPTSPATCRGCPLSAHVGSTLILGHFTTTPMS
ncbi:mCG147390 [Mus musculus]|nr:mCG147390 [Mus musculus]